MFRSAAACSFNQESSCGEQPIDRFPVIAALRIPG